MNYHHESALTKLCQELASAGFQQQARNAHMACMTAGDDKERAAIMRKLTGQVRKLREMRAAQELFVLNAAAALALLIAEEGTKVDAIFMLPPEKAAEKAADYLMQNVSFDAARRKLLNDYTGSTGVNEQATNRILTVVNERQQRAAAWLSLYGARAGGMSVGTYRSEVVDPAVEALKERIDDLDPGVREKLKL